MSGESAGDQSPKFGAVVRVNEVGELVDNYVITYPHRNAHQLKVERQRSATGAGTPAGRLVSNLNAGRLYAHLIGPAIYAISEVTCRLRPHSVYLGSTWSGTARRLALGDASLGSINPVCALIEESIDGVPAHGVWGSHDNAPRARHLNSECFAP